MGTIWTPNIDTISGPKYNALIQSIREAIRTGALKPDEKLPPVRDLAWALKITPGTVARAYRIGVEEGLLRGETGRGTFVARGQEDRIADPVDPLYSDIVDGFIDLRPTRLPDMGQSASLRAALLRVAEAPDLAISYPQETNTMPVRQAISDWLEPGLIGEYCLDEIFLTLGAQHATNLALQTLLTGPNPVILTEALTYPGFRHTARNLRAKLVGVEMDQHGLRPDALADACREHGAQALVTSANVHNPTGVYVPLTRRQEIVDVALSFQLPIIEDDCHRIATASDPSYRALAPDLCWYAGSLSKSYCAALRFGYMVPARPLKSRTRQVVSSSFYGLPQILLDVVEQALRSGDASRIRALIEKEIRSRVRTALDVLGHRNLSWREDVPFIWLPLPPGWRGSNFTSACEQAGIKIRSADVFAPTGAAHVNGVRISLNLELQPEKLLGALRKIDEILNHPEETVWD